MIELDEIVKEFLVESFENLEQLDRELLALENNPDDLDSLNSIFRIIHTVKGTCGFFDFRKLEAITHVGENLLDSLRAGRIRGSEEIVTTLLALSDAVRGLLASIEQTGSEGNGDFTALAATLTRLNEQRASGTDAPSVTAPTAPIEEERPVITLSNVVSCDEPAGNETREPSNEPAAEKAADAGEAKKSELAETTLRVDVNVLDKLMNLVGELVLARNQILQYTKSQTNPELIGSSQRLNLITSELQDGVMRTRMQPISTLWNKLPRIVRDVAHSCGKEVRLEMVGKETELDKAIIEAIKDPLTHVIRNAVDHGIEAAAVRRQGGKRAEGTLVLRAFHEGGQVVIEIADDGGGLNIQRIRAKAIEKGIITASKAESMSDGDVYRLIFLPGFSTAEKVTNLSGRGVGMDVVRSNIERVGGTVDVTSKPGHGTTFTIKIPLTLAIIPALTVTTCGVRYAIPQVNLLELVRVERSQKGLERVNGSDFYRLRGKLLPLIYLRSELGLPSSTEEEDRVLSIVVVRADHHQFGLVVDTIHDTEEIVVKPLGRLLKGLSIFAGATIMGDGQVALILDVVGLARKANITRKDSTVVNAHETLDEQSADEQRKFLVFQVGANNRGAVPLDQVYRLEEFAPEKLEHAGDSLVVQYRSGILPLVDLRTWLKQTPVASSEEIVRAFVYNDGEQLVGFVVDSILDIVEQALKIERPCSRPGLLGSAIIQDRVTDIIDLQSIINATQSHVASA